MWTTRFLKLRKNFIQHIIFFLFASFSGDLLASSIEYTSTYLGGQRWRNDYVISNDNSFDISELSIFFQPDIYFALELTSSPVQWDPLLIQPDKALPADGYIDLFALGAPLSIGSSLSSLSISFDFVGVFQPPVQHFEIVDPTNFATLETGMTVAASSVPEANSALLLLTGCLLISFRIRKLGGAS